MINLSNPLDKPTGFDFYADILRQTRPKEAVKIYYRFLFEERLKREKIKEYTSSNTNIEDIISNHKKENTSLAAVNEGLNEKVSVYKSDLKLKEHDLIRIKKQIDDLKETIEDGKIESTIISQKVIKLIENLNDLQINNQEVMD